MNKLKGKKILIFTGGGLAPALNPTLAGLISAAQKAKMKIAGGLYGWACLLDNGQIIDISNINSKVIAKQGGTFLRSSRTSIFKTQNGLEQLKLKLKEHDIDYVVAIGGNDTLGAARELFEKENIKIIGLPKTIDNDLSATYWSPGHPSAARQMAQVVKEIRTDAAHALSRIFVVEAMGMHAGWLALAGAGGRADVIIPPEKEVSLEKVMRLTEQAYRRNGNFACVVVSQEAHFDQPLTGIADDQQDSYGTKRQSYICLALRDAFKEKLAIDSKAIYPGNFLETGPAIDIDRDMAFKLGQKAIELLAQDKFGFMPTVIRDGKKIKTDIVSLDKVVGQENYRYVPDDFFDWENLQATDKYLDYAKPFLGDLWDKNDEAYAKIIKNI